MSRPPVVAGELVAGVVHDLRNVVLAPLALQVERASYAIEQRDHERVAAIVGDLRTMLSYAEHAVDRLSHFARQLADAPLRTDEVSPGELATRAIALASAHVRRADREPPIELVASDSALPTIRVDIHEVVAALVNLIVNAVDAVRGQGRVSVAIGHDDQAVWFAVRDDGPGIPEHIRARMFEPFVTAKGHGSGLGLAMVSACAQRHRGSVELDTATGRGTRIVLRLPR